MGVSKGTLPPPENPTVEFEGDVLTFKWDVVPNSDYRLNRDQVMMLAYKPANNMAKYVLSGARRTEGTDTMEVHVRKKDWGQFVKDTVIETYIAFISDDRQRISDSVYVGQIVL